MELMKRPIKTLRLKLKGAGSGSGCAGSQVALLSAPDFTSGMGKGLKEPVSPYRTANVFGADLNTPSANDWNAPPQIVTSTAVFDLSALTPDHEVVVALTVLFNLTQGGILQHLWSRESDKAILFDWGFQVPSPSAYGYTSWLWYYVYSYIGYDAWEINQNGGYQVAMRWNPGPGWTELATLPFAVTGIPSPQPVVSDFDIASLLKQGVAA